MIWNKEEENPTNNLLTIGFSAKKIFEEYFFVSKETRLKNYQDLFLHHLNCQIGRFFNSANVNLLFELQKIIENHRWKVGLSALKMKTKKFSNFIKENKAELTNLALILTTPQNIEINKQTTPFNQIVIYFDFEMKTDQNNQKLFTFNAKRIEFFTVISEDNTEKTAFSIRFNGQTMQETDEQFRWFIALFPYMTFQWDFAEFVQKDPIELQKIAYFFQKIFKKFSDKENNKENYYLLARDQSNQDKLIIFGEKAFTNQKLVLQDPNWTEQWSIDYFQILPKENPITVWKNNVANLNKYLQVTNQQIEQHQEQIAEIKKTLFSTQKELEDQTFFFSQLDEEIDLIANNEIEQLKKQIQSLEQQISKLNSQVKSFKDKQRQFKIQLDFLNQQLEFAQDYPIVHYVKLTLAETKSDFSLEQITTIQETNLTDEKFFKVETNDVARYSLIRRQHFALKNLKAGVYKNPKLVSAIYSPNKISKLLELSAKTIQKYKLADNPEQHLAVQKAISSDSIFYLQGPPGTGKTQTLCAISEELLDQQQNVVISSSTHEAIENFLDRLDQKNDDNPNIILLKYAFYNRRDSKYDEDKIYQRFCYKIYRHLTKTSVSQLPDFSTTFSILPCFFSNNLRNVIKCLQELNLFTGSSDLMKFPECFYINDRIMRFAENCFSMEQLLQSDENYWKRMENDFDDTLQKLRQYNSQSFLEAEKNYNLLNEYLDWLFNYLNLHPEAGKQFVQTRFDHWITLIKQLNTKNPESPRERLVYFLKTAMQNEFSGTNSAFSIFSNDGELSFLKYIWKKQLINVIGITTTSRESISLNKLDKSYHLFSEYPVDLLIIDEVSKSTTAEIISKIILSKRTVLSGDWLQLPPNGDCLSESDCEYLIQTVEESPDDSMSSKREFQRFLQAQQEDFLQDPEQAINLVKQNISQTMANSFFKIQRNKIQNGGLINSQSPYQNLRLTHRFQQPELAELVNIIYRTCGESLSFVANNNLNLKPIYLEVNNQTLNAPVCIVDTSVTSTDFYFDHSINEQYSNFDQKGVPFKFRLATQEIKNMSDACYNQYSAYVIAKKIIPNLFQQNSELTNKKQVGIIALTIAQRNMIRYYLDYFCKEWKQNLKVDTIDNFQGRECDVMIVDFIRGKNKIEDGKKINLRGKRNIDFLANFRRLNVAVSRCRQKIILVGNFNAYLNDLTIDLEGTPVQLFQEYYQLAAGRSVLNLG